MYRVLTCLLLLTLAVASAQDLRPVWPLLGPVPVLHVIDGDTVVLESNLGPRTVRLIGIDAPEMSTGQPGLVARERLARLLPEGTLVWVEVDMEPEDRYGRLLAYLYVWDAAGAWPIAGRQATQVNLAMLEGGLADTLTIPPNVTYAHLYDAALEQALARGAATPVAPLATSASRAISLHCALVNPSTDNDTGAEWVSVMLNAPTDTTGYYLRDEGSGSTFRLPGGVQPAGELRLTNPGQGVWNNSGDTIYLVQGGEVVDQWTYGRELAVEDRVACR